MSAFRYWDYRGCWKLADGILAFIPSSPASTGFTQIRKRGNGGTGSTQVSVDGKEDKSLVFCAKLLHFSKAQGSFP
jgi:hypothetical protein